MHNFNNLIDLHMLNNLLHIFNIYVLSYSYIIPNNNLIHIFQYQPIQNMDIYIIDNIYLQVNMQNIWVRQDIYLHKYVLNHHHKNYLDNLLHKYLLFYLHIMLDFMDILLHISMLNYLHMNHLDIFIHIGLLNYLHMIQQDMFLHKMLYYHQHMYPTNYNSLHIGVCYSIHMIIMDI